MILSIKVQVNYRFLSNFAWSLIFFFGKFQKFKLFLILLLFVTFCCLISKLQRIQIDIKQERSQSERNVSPKLYREKPAKPVNSNKDDLGNYKDISSDKIYSEVSTKPSLCFLQEQ